MKKTVLLAALFGLSISQAFAQVTVTNAWVRGTVPGQTASGAFMTLRAAHATTLVAVSTPAAASAEVHEMKMEGNMMKMRAVDSLPLPAGQTVTLQPGGYHIMLNDLKAQLKEGEKITLTLKFQDAGKKIEEEQVSAEVRSLTATGAAPAHGGMSH